MIYFIGDLHGSCLAIENLLRRRPEIAETASTNTLICLGDFGGNYYLNKKDNHFKEKLSKYPFKNYFIIRGNHEERVSICMKKNPNKWHTETFFDNQVYVENEFPNIKYALDIPFIYTIDTYKTLILPGAYSVDKWYRLRMNFNWFEHEQLSEEEMNYGRKLIQINDYSFDLVLSHTCPISYVPTDLFLPSIDQSMVDNTMERYLGEIEYQIKYKAWLWGHYHATRQYPIVEDGSKRIMLFDEAMKLDDIMKDNNDYIEVL